MGLEVAFDYVDDLNSSWPLGSDPKSEGDNHIAGTKNALQGNIAGDGTYTALKVAGQQLLVKNQNELIARAPAAGNNVIRLQDDDGVTNRLNVFRNGGAATPVSQLRVQTPGEEFNLEVRDVADSSNLKQIRLTPEAVHLGYAGADAVSSTLAGVDAVAQAGTLAVASIAATDALAAQFAAKNTEGQLFLRADGNGFQGLLADAAGANEEQFFGALRGGESYMAHAGSARVTATAGGAKVEGGELLLDGGPDADVSLVNAAGDYLVSNGLALGLASKAGEGFEGYALGQLALKAIENGARVLNGGGGDAVLELFRGTLKATVAALADELRISPAAGSELRLRRNSTGNVLLTASNGRTSLYGDGTERLRVLEAAVENAFGSVRDGGGNWRGIGFNTLPGGGSATSQRALASTDGGFKLRCNGGSYTLNADDVEANFTVIIYTTSACTFTGTGTTWQWFAGGGSVISGSTLSIAGGSVVEISRRGSGGNFEVWGNGISVS